MINFGRTESKNFSPLGSFSRETGWCHLKIIPCPAFYPIIIYSAPYDKQTKVLKKRKVLSEVPFGKKEIKTITLEKRISFRKDSEKGNLIYFSS